MYPFARLFITCANSVRASRLAPDDVGVTHFYVRPWDIDIFGEMNNGRILTLYDIGRFDLSIRLGMVKTMRRKGWGLVVAGASVMYRKRLYAFNRVEVRTQIVGHDEKWTYMAQSMWVGGAPASSILVRTGVTSRDGIVPPRDVGAALGLSEYMLALPDWAANWHNADMQRPWPPAF